jgi:hypothetical protein
MESSDGFDVARWGAATISRKASYGGARLCVLRPIQRPRMIVGQLAGRPHTGILRTLLAVQVFYGTKKS